MMISTEKSALTTSFSFIIQTILSNNDPYSPIIDEHYLIIHTFRGAPAHSCCVAGDVASLPLSNSAVEELPICLQRSRPHGTAVHLTAVSPVLTNSYTHIKPQMTDNCNPHTTCSLVSAMYMTTCNLTSSIPHRRRGPQYTT
jgi:hypothetical protein